MRPGAGHLPVAAVRLGLVLWTDDAHGDAVAQDLLAAFASIPSACDVLVLCPEPAVAAAAAGRPGVAVEVGGAFASALPAALRRMTADYLCFHHLSDRIAPPALDLVAAALSAQPHTDVLFGDEDWIDDAGRRGQPFMKPGWDPELQRGQDLVGPFAFYRTALLHRLGHEPSGPAWRYDLAGRVTAASQPNRVCHLPAVLCHRRAPVPPGAADAMARHAGAQLRDMGIAADIEPLNVPRPWQRVAYALPQPAPLVSVVVPTRDRADLLRPCTDGVLNRTRYSNIELLIIDNGTKEAEALALIDALSHDARVRVLRRPEPFNWSALNNAAAGVMRGDVLLLLNNDVAVLRPDWLDPLVALAVQPGVGAVGAKLLYPDGRVQHAGITTDMDGVPRHLFRHADPDDAGPSGLLALSRDVWAVTGACVATRREVFFEVGGLNEGLPVAYNDIDFCMRLTVQGYRIVWTPNAVLEHRELASRPPDHVGPRREQAREELNRLIRDWGNLVLRDPFVNPNYRLTEERLVFRAGPFAPDAVHG